MKRNLLFWFILNLLPLGVFAQVPQTPVILDEEEAEEMELDSLSYLVETMNKHGNSLALEAKRKASWKRKSFFRISYTKSTMEPSSGVGPDFVADDGQLMLDGTNKGNDLYKFKNEYGVSIMNGKNISLHKKPIVNMVQIALDYTWIDLNYNNYKGFYEKNGKMYNSSQYFVSTDEDGRNKKLKYTPWGLDKHEINYGMSLGPSITVAPFGLLDTNARNLHIQGYFHVGYSFSLNMFKTDDKLDTAGDIDGFLGMWGHGLNTSWGMNISWKVIGIGFEKRSGTFSYKSLDTGNYGNQKNKFDYKNTRFYLTLNF